MPLSPSAKRTREIESLCAPGEDALTPVVSTVGRVAEADLRLKENWREAFSISPKRPSLHIARLEDCRNVVDIPIGNIKRKFRYPCEVRRSWFLRGREKFVGAGG